MPKIFLLNGPAESGKDHGANFLSMNVPASNAVVKFAEPLKAGATAFYCLGDRAAFDTHDQMPQKNQPHDTFFGKSCRDVQIAISETFLKIFHDDQSIFGKIMIRRINNLRRHGIMTFFVSDSGFLAEAETLVNEYGAENIVLIRLHREGKTYSGDSRGYINLDHVGVQSFDVQNPEGQVDVFEKTLKDIVTPLITAQ